MQWHVVAIVLCLRLMLYTLFGREMSELDLLVSYVCLQHFSISIIPPEELQEPRGNCSQYALYISAEVTGFGEGNANVPALQPMRTSLN